MLRFKGKISSSAKRGLKQVVRQSRALQRRWVKGAIGFLHHVVGAKPKHLVISGCPRSGTTMLYNMIRSSASGQIYMPDRELTAVATYNRRDTRIVTKRPLDILHLPQIDADLGPMRDVLHLVLVRDPRDLVSSKHRSAPNQFFQGYDYQFFIRPGVKSFGGPGIGAIGEAIELAEAEGRRILVIRYEDLVRNPESFRRLLSFATGFPLTRPFSSFHSADIPNELAVQLNGIRPVEAPDRPAWTKGERYDRACHQLNLFPEIEELAKRWGYAAIGEMRQAYELPVPKITDEPGTIVAFHTDDPFYTNEAARCRKRLEQLGLPHDFTTVRSNGSWVKNCARKPEFLLEARKRLRGPLLYIDVDAFVHRDPWPYLAGYEGDMAAYVHGDGTLWSGTILLNDTESTIRLLHGWVERQKKAPEIFDQVILQQAIEADESGPNCFRFQRLPPNLTFIGDRAYPYLYGAPVIEHLQASRVSKHGRRGDKMDLRIKALDAKAEGFKDD